MEGQHTEDLNKTENLFAALRWAVPISLGMWAGIIWLIVWLLR